jgi:hypothetical protein
VRASSLRSRSISSRLARDADRAAKVHVGVYRVERGHASCGMARIGAQPATEDAPTVDKVRGGGGKTEGRAPTLRAEDSGAAGISRYEGCISHVPACHE